MNGFNSRISLIYYVGLIECMYILHEKLEMIQLRKWEELFELLLFYNWSCLKGFMLLVHFKIYTVAEQWYKLYIDNCVCGGDLL